MSPHRQRVVDAREALADAAAAESSPELRQELVALVVEVAGLVGRIEAREEIESPRRRSA